MPEYLRCEECGTTTVPRKGKGLCRNCYMRDYRARHRAPKVDVDTAEQVRQEMFYAIAGLYGKMRVPCPLRYKDGVLALTVGKATNQHTFSTES